MTDRPLDDFLQDILREIERIERFTDDIQQISIKSATSLLR
jgi:uncharacterized protein with HEPN domain